MNKLVSAVAVLALSIVSSSFAQEASEPPLPKNKAELEQFVRGYLLRHPEVIIEAVKVYQENERNAEKARTTRAIQARYKQLFEDPSSPITATPAPVTIVEFFDYKCGYCKKVTPTVNKLVSDAKVRIIYKEFPILGPDSMVAARAALAAKKQNRYLDLHQELWQVSGPINMAAIETLAAKLKLDFAKLKADMESPDIQAALNANEQLAGAIGVSATPSFVIGDELITGAMDEEAFAEALGKVGKKK